MANFDEHTEEALEDGEEVVNLDEQDEQPAVETAPAEELPDKYRGKSPSEIAKMHQELEKMMGRQAQEVGELRKLTDEILRQQLAPKTTAPQEEEMNFFEDPEKAVAKLVAKHPDVVAARTTQDEMRKQVTAQRLKEQFPDMEQVAASAEFQNWVLGSNVRKRMFAEANAFDYDSAVELLSTWKQINPGKAAPQATRQEMEAAQSVARKAATVDTGGAGETSKKVYRRADLIRLKMTDPSRYEMLSDEIMAAYSEGRVK